MEGVEKVRQGKEGKGKLCTGYGKEKRGLGK